MFKIEKNIPVPIHIDLFPLEQMEIGDSFVIPFNNFREAQTIRIMISGYSRRHKEGRKKFISRINKEKREVRVWRIK